MAGKRTDTDSASDNDAISVDGGKSGEIEITGNSDDAGPVDPAAVNDGLERDADGNIVIGANGKPRRKRGRKSGAIGGNASSNKSSGAGSNKALKSSIDSLSQTLMVLHMGIGNLINFPDFKLDQKEADALAEATANVMDQFDFAPDPRITAVMGLVSVAGTIYVPRYYLYQKSRESKSDNKVVPIFDGNNGMANGGSNFTTVG